MGKFNQIDIFTTLPAHMKTRLTVSLKQRDIDRAKRRAKAKGISVSKMIEEIFEESEPAVSITETQGAAQWLLARLKQAKYTQTKSDSDLIHTHVKRKFA